MCDRHRQRVGVRDRRAATERDVARLWIEVNAALWEPAAEQAFVRRLVAEQARDEPG